MFVALIGDIVGSRRLEGRQAVQTQVEQSLARLTDELAASHLVAPLVLTAGDEIQGLFREPPAVLPVVLGLSEALHPVRMAFGLGLGTLTTWGGVGEGVNVARMDGPCFHRARDALTVAKKERRWLSASGFGENSDVVLSALFLLMGTIRFGWTRRQALFVREARGALQKDVAAKLQVSPSVVSESLKAAGFSSLLEGEEAVRRLLAAVESAPSALRDSP